MEKQGESYFLPVLKNEKDFCLLLIKDPVLQQNFICHHFIQHMFIVCKFSDKRQDQRGIFPLGISEFNPVTHICPLLLPPLSLPGINHSPLFSQPVHDLHDPDTV